jgi:hypothetical protein
MSQNFKIEIYQGSIDFDHETFKRISLLLPDYDFYMEGNYFIWWSKDRFVRLSIDRYGEFEIIKGETLFDFQPCHLYQVGKVDMNKLYLMIKSKFGELNIKEDYVREVVGR